MGSASIRFAPYVLSSVISRLGRTLRHRPTAGSGRRGGTLHGGGGRIVRLRKCHSGLVRCSGRLSALKRHGSCSGASPNTAFVHVGRSTVGGKRAGPKCGLRVNARGRFVASFHLFPGPASALALVPFFRSFRCHCGHLPGVYITSSNCNSRRGCQFVRRGKVRTFVGCGCFRGRRHPHCAPGPFRTRDLRCGTRRSCCIYPVKRRVGHVKAGHSGATDKCVARDTQCGTGEYRNYPLHNDYFGTQKGHVVRIGRQLGRCGQRTQRELLSRRNVGRENEEYVRPRTIFKRVGCGVTCEEFQRIKRSGIAVSFTFFTVTFGVGGVYTGLVGRKGKLVAITGCVFVKLFVAQCG